jgi:hypothetical protein
MVSWKLTVRTWQHKAKQGLFQPRQRQPFVPINKKNQKINELNKRKAELMRQPQTPAVLRELEQIRVKLAML